MIRNLVILGLLIVLFFIGFNVFSEFRKKKPSYDVYNNRFMRSNGTSDSDTDDYLVTDSEQEMQVLKRENEKLKKELEKPTDDTGLEIDLGKLSAEKYYQHLYKYPVVPFDFYSESVGNVKPANMDDYSGLTANTSAY